MARDAKFYAELKQLNEDFAKFIDETLKKSAYFNLSPTLNDYIKQFNSLEKQYPLSSDTSNAATAPPPTLTLPSVPPSAAAANTTTLPQLPTAPTVTTTPATPAAPAPILKLNPTLSSLPSSGFSFGSSLFAPTSNTNTTTPAVNTTSTPFATSFTFNPTPVSVNHDTTNSQNTADGDDNDDPPPPPPEPNVDKYEEPDAKYQIRCKLYERNVGPSASGQAQVTLLGFGVLFVKELDQPNKLQVIVRQDPDLRKVLLNEVITHNIPLKLLPKAVQMVVPGPNGESKFYITKVKDEKDAEHLHELLNSAKHHVVT